MGGPSACVRGSVGGRAACVGVGGRSARIPAHRRPTGREHPGGESLSAVLSRGRLVDCHEGVPQPGEALPAPQPPREGSDHRGLAHKVEVDEVGRALEALSAREEDIVHVRLKRAGPRQQRSFGRRGAVPALPHQLDGHSLRAQAVLDLAQEEDRGRRALGPAAWIGIGVIGLRTRPARAGHARVRDPHLRWRAGQSRTRGERPRARARGRCTSPSHPNAPVQQRHLNSREGREVWRAGGGGHSGGARSPRRGRRRCTAGRHLRFLRAKTLPTRWHCPGRLTERADR